MVNHLLEVVFLSTGEIPKDDLVTGQLHQSVLFYEAKIATVVSETRKSMFGQIKEMGQ